MDIHADLELEMKISRRELRLFLIHEFCLGQKTTEATSNICRTMGKDALSIRTAQRWFNQFKNGNFEFDDLPHTGSRARRVHLFWTRMLITLLILYTQYHNKK